MIKLTQQIGPLHVVYGVTTEDDGLVPGHFVSTVFYLDGFAAEITFYPRIAPPKRCRMFFFETANHALDWIDDIMNARHDTYDEPEWMDAF